MGKKTPQINSSSTADIAFLLLCYFLMTTTMDQQLGIERQLPQIPTAEKQKNQKARKRNLFIVRINHKDKVFVQKGEEIFKDLEFDKDPVKAGKELRKMVYDFFMNGAPGYQKNSPVLPERNPVEISGFAKYNGGSNFYSVSKGIISLQYNSVTSYHRFIAVQNELVAGINDVRKAFSEKYFRKDYSELGKAELAIIKEAVPQNISESEPFKANP